MPYYYPNCQTIPIPRTDQLLLGPYHRHWLSGKCLEGSAPPQPPVLSQVMDQYESKIFNGKHYENSKSFVKIAAVAANIGQDFRALTDSQIEYSVVATTPVYRNTSSDRLLYGSYQQLPQQVYRSELR